MKQTPIVDSGIPVSAGPVNLAERYEKEEEEADKFDVENTAFVKGFGCSVRTFDTTESINPYVIGLGEHENGVAKVFGLVAVPFLSVSCIQYCLWSVLSVSCIVLHVRVSRHLASVFLAFPCPSFLQHSLFLILQCTHTLILLSL